MFFTLMPALVVAATMEEYTAKAGFVFNFIKFIDWPKTAFVDDTEPFQLCIFGPQNVSTSFRQLEKHAAKGRSIKVSALAELSPATTTPCHILYITETANTDTELASRLPSNHPVLTIGETPQFAREGGVINFVIVDNRVKFEINTASARARQMQISSKLSALAVHVYDDGGTR